MARRSAQPAYNPAFQDFQFDVESLGLQQAPAQQQPAEETGFWEKAYNSGAAVLEGLTLAPQGIADTIKNAWNGGQVDVSDEAALEERRKREAEIQAYQQKWAGKTFEGIPDAMVSMPYSAATMGASLGAGAIGMLAGPAAAAAAGMGASGTLAYRATKDDFMYRLLDKTKEALGRMPTQEEWDNIAAEFDSEATKYGLWEAGPEAISNLLMAKLLGPLGKNILKGGIGGAVKRIGGLYGEEFATETGTQMGQGAIEADLGWREKAPNAGEALKEIAPATFWQTTLMAGGKKAADFAYNRLAKRNESIGNNADETQQEQAAGLGGTQSLPDFEAPQDMPQWEGQESSAENSTEWEWRAFEKRVAAEREEARRDSINRNLANQWDLLANAVNPRPEPVDVSGVKDDLFRSWERYGEAINPQPEEIDISGARAGIFDSWDAYGQRGGTGQKNSDAFDSGEAVDLLQPQGPRIAQEPGGGAAMQAPSGNGAENISGITAAGNAGTGIRQGLTGNIMPIATAPAPAQVSQTANAAAPIIPAQSQITNTQQQPRQDTTAQAQNLGMPAPNALPQEAQKQPEISPARGAVPAAQNIAPQVMPAADTSMPAGQMLESGIGQMPNMGAVNGGQEAEQQGISGLQQGYGGGYVQLPDGDAPRTEGRRPDGSRGADTAAAEGRKKRKIKIPNHADEGVSYELMEADDVHASHIPEAGFHTNPNYQLENERRYHDEPASQAKVLENARNLDPSFLIESVDANHGAPVIDRQGNVLGGNGRAMSVRMAYEKFPQKAEGYRQALKENAESLGIDPKQIDRLKRPVLVRRIDRDMDAAEGQALVTALNDTFTDSKHARASGKSRGDRLGRKTLEAIGHGLQDADSLRDFFDKPESANVVEMLIKDGVIHPTERNALVSEDGLLNPDGKKIVEAALRGRVAKSYEALDALPAAVVGKIDAAIPYVLIAENIGKEWNVTPHVTDAVDLVAEFHTSKTDSPHTFLNQLNMTKGGKAPSERYSPAAQTLFLMMLDAKKKEFAKAFERFAAQAKLSQGGLGVGLEKDVAFDEAFDGKKRHELIAMLPEEEAYSARREMTNQQIRERLKELKAQEHAKPEEKGGDIDKAGEENRPLTNESASGTETLAGSNAPESRRDQVTTEQPDAVDLEKMTRTQLLGQLKESDRNYGKTLVKPKLVAFVRKSLKEYERHYLGKNSDGQDVYADGTGKRIIRNENGSEQMQPVLIGISGIEIPSVEELHSKIIGGSRFLTDEEFESIGRSGQNQGGETPSNESASNVKLAKTEENKNDDGVRESAGRQMVGEPSDLADGEQRAGTDTGVVEQSGSQRPSGRSGSGDSEGMGSGTTSEGEQSSGRGDGAGNGADMSVSGRVSGKRAAGGNEGRNLEVGGENQGGSGGTGGRQDNGNLESGEIPAARNSNNHRINEGDTLVPGGNAARAKANIEAIKLLQKLDAEKRPATEEEKKILQQFTGWGSLAQTVFRPEFERMADQETRGVNISGFYSADEFAKYRKWKKEYGEVLHPKFGGMLTEEEWSAAAKSTLNAHYTDRKVISAMWKMVEKMGFKGGRILEPSAGTGLFFGLMPEKISHNSSLAAVELDRITGKILKYLYPDADIQISGYESAKRLGDNSVDLAISNVPFGNFSVFDKKRPQYNKQSIHNYFFSRTLDTVKPGGIVAFITSHHTLDAGIGPLREEWGRKADLVAAIRLPGDAFKKNAGTEVTTDIIIFRKKSDSDFSLGQAFRNLQDIQTKDGTATINEYFVGHPEMALGEHSLQGSMYGGNEYTLLSRPGEAIEEALEKAINNIPADIYGVEATNTVTNAATMSRAADENAKEGTLVEKDGQVWLVNDGQLEAPSWGANKTKVAQAKSYNAIKNKASELIRAMNEEEGDTKVNELREELNRLYDGYHEKYGAINDSKSSYLEDDLEFPSVSALEEIHDTFVERPIKSGPNKGKLRPCRVRTYSKADIFSKRTIYPFHAPDKADSTQDAVKISRIYKNRIDLPYIASMLGTTVEQAKTRLLESGEIFENPGNGLLEPHDIYLSGNVREKLQRAEEAAKDNPAYEANVKALKEVLPQKIGIENINAKIGSTWIPSEVYEGFMRHLGVAHPDIAKIRLTGESGTTQWKVGGYGLSAEANKKWSTGNANVCELMQDCLNLKRTVVMDHFKENGKPRSARNENETLAAQEKQRLLQEEFSKWLPQSRYAEQIENEYNNLFNSFVRRHFEVPNIKYYPGANQSIELRDNQKKGVYRGLQESCLLAHGVGSGKTMLQITLAMEMRRLGTAKKPWVVVQDATLMQFATSFKKLYPGARILAPTKEQRSANNRRRLLAQIATGDWDAIITPQGFFNNVSVSPETEKRFIQEQIDEFKDTLSGVENDDNRTRKAIEKSITRLENKLENLANIRKDENIYFDELGIDALIIDEAHAYKRGMFATKMDNVKGLDRDSSQRSLQLLMKARMVQAKTGGKNVVLSTGTPISNTLTEMWTMFRYIRPDLLKQFNVEQFDDFATAFAETTVSQEETATGEWKDVERFNKYVNGSELLTLWSMGADVAITEDLSSIKDLPKLKGGKIHEVTVERSEALANYIEALREERIAWDKLSGKEKSERSAVPLTIYGRAKKAAIDLRLVDSTLADEHNSKANVAVQNIFERWKNTLAEQATQIVFSDTFQSGDKKFNLFKDIKDKLVNLGIPAKEIAIIHDFKSDKAREDLFKRVNSGEVRVLMGTTEKLGVGVNVQERLMTAHHLDAPQRPMDFEQRNGRIRRPGNMNAEVEILTYGTKNTLDSVTFQQLISKQKFINQLLRGNVSERSFENPFDATQATFEDMMAAFSGNPLAKEKMQLTSEVRNLLTKLEAHYSQIRQQKADLRNIQTALQRATEKLPIEKKAIEFLKDHFPDNKIPNRKKLAKDAGEWIKAKEGKILSALKGVNTQGQWYSLNKKEYTYSRDIDLGNGVKAIIEIAPQWNETFEHKTDGNDEILVEKDTKQTYRLSGPHEIADTSEFRGASGLFTRIENALAKRFGWADASERRISELKKQIEVLKNEINRPFAQQEELDSKSARLKEVEDELKSTSAQETQEEIEEVIESGSGIQLDGGIAWKNGGITPNASIAPGQFLPSRNSNSRGSKAASVQKTVAALNKSARNAASSEVVQGFAELPKYLRDIYSNNAASLEAVYDPRSRKVYFVADNISDAVRTAEVWAHEQIVHHGLRGMLDAGELSRLMNNLWMSMGGMGNSLVKQIADTYRLKPRTSQQDRLTVMEEVVAHLAESRQLGRLTRQQESMWQKVVRAITRMWNKIVERVTGRPARMGYEQVDNLLTALGNYVIHGEQAFDLQADTAGAMASVGEGQTKELAIDRLKDHINEAKPLASLSLREIVGLGTKQAAKVAEDPEIRSFVNKNDLTLMQSFLQLPHWIAKQFPKFAQIYDRQIRRLDERAAALRKSIEGVPSLFGKTRLKGADLESLKSMLWEIEGQQTATEKLLGVDKFISKEKLANGRSTLEVNPQFYDMFQEVLDSLSGTAKAKAALMEIRKSLDNDFVLAYNRMASMSEVSDDAITNYRQLIGQIPNYFPHHRYGRYYIQGKLNGEVVYRRHFDQAGGKTAAKAKGLSLIRGIRSADPDVDYSSREVVWEIDENSKLPDEVLGAPVDGTAMEQIIKAATSQIADKEQAAKINELLNKSVADVLKTRGWGSHGINRKNIPGYEKDDITRVLYDYKAGLNGWLTKMDAARDFSRGLAAIDARKQPNLWKYASQYTRDMLRNSDNIDRISGNIKSIAFAWYLGANIKTAVVNATQNLVVGVPRLQMDVTGGAQLWLKGASDALANQITGNKGRGLLPDEARLIQELYGEKVINEAFMDEIRGQLNGVTGARIWNKFTEALGWPMAEVEKFNRASLALAAFRAARSGKLKQSAKDRLGIKGEPSYDEAKKFASEIVRDSHFIYGKANQPEFMRSNTAGRAMSSLYTFRTFTHNMVNMWLWALKTQGKEGALFTAKSLGATMVLGGVTALPLYATLMAIFQGMTGDDDDWTEMIRDSLPKNNMLRDVVCYGMPAVAGVNIGGSLKMETPVTQGLRKGKNPKEMLTESIGDIIGIPYDLAFVKTSNVMNAIDKGNYWRAVEEAVPTFVKNGMQAYRLATEGQTTMSGKPVNSPGQKGARKFTTSEAIGKMLGFQPVSSTKSWDAYSAETRRDEVRNNKINEVVVMVMRARKGHGVQADAVSEIRKWNERMKAEGKPGMTFTMKDVLRRVKQRTKENSTKPKQLEKGARQMATWGI